ncbi:MAG: DUF4406 domain-containing protein [Parcubacteria group bacterium]|nr:DUF4406 domain-containing protein [Parcubacteria group bacterium]
MTSNRYITKYDEMALRQAETFEDLAKIAIRLLMKMPQPIGIVSGPISTGGAGSKESNLEAMENTIQHLSHAGMKIFSQMPFEDHMARIMKTPYYKGGNHLLETFYGAIFASGYISIIYFMPTWRTSVGSTWEHDLAVRLGIDIVYL